MTYKVDDAIEAQGLVMLVKEINEDKCIGIVVGVSSSFNGLGIPMSTEIASILRGQYRGYNLNDVKVAKKESLTPDVKFWIEQFSGEKEVCI